MRAKDIKNFLRPNLWIYILAIYLMPLLASGISFSLLVLTGAAVFILINTASITLNHYFDRKTDALSSQDRFPVAKGVISPGTTLGFSILIMILPLLLTFYFPIQASLLTLLAIFMIVAYSAPPLRIKERPYLETFWNGIGYGTLPFYLAITMFSIPLTEGIHILGLIPFLISASGHTLLQVRDIDSDVRGNVKTTSTRHGIKMIAFSRTMIALAGILIIYLTLTNFLNPLAWISVFSGALIFIQHKKMKKDVTKSYPLLKLLYLVGGIAFLLSLL